MKNFSKTFIYALLIFVLLSGTYALIQGEFKSPKQIALSELVADINAGRVEKITVEEETLAIRMKDGSEATSRKEAEAGLSESLKNYGVDAEKLRDVNLEIKSIGGAAYWFGMVLPILAPILLIAFFIWWTARQVQRGSMQAFSFGQSRARLVNPENTRERVLFKDVAGVKEAKEELREIVDFLRNPKKFFDIGARIPRGVLLMGAPGTGKTLLARAVAGEANVPFFHISGSEFVEMFVGVGASVTGDTPVLVRQNGKTALRPIDEVVDAYYQHDEAGLKKVSGLETLGAARGKTGFRGFKTNKEKFPFGGSAWTPVEHVYRHHAKEIYHIAYLGGAIRATGDHSVFVREKNYIRAKRVDELRAGDVLVNLPEKVRSVFIPGLGTTHKVHAHAFEASVIPELDIWDEAGARAENGREYALAYAGALTQREMGETLGVSQATVGNWIRGVHEPRMLSRPSIAWGLPSRTRVSPNLMRLLGYYAAEGRTTRYAVEFVFGAHEKNLHEDCIRLMREQFHLEPRVQNYDSATRITYSSEALARFFERYSGNGSHRKHVPAFIWDLPFPFVHEYILGYSRGDGYETREGKLSMTSVSQNLIRELSWLLAMHGIQTGVRRMVHPTGRTIREGGKPLPKTVAWNLIIGKTSNLWSDRVLARSTRQFKKPRITKIERIPYDGFVYDFCGCQNEAFFGGEKPTLLHNSRVRDLFKVAKKSAPSIIFMDEIDAVGRHRGAGLGGGHDEREQTLNQILVEMDGFEQNESVIIIAATNRPDVLDPALLRPGRFDRRVVIDPPDINDREEILKIHAKSKAMEKDINLRIIAERTPGFSGADLANVVNEAAILAARKGRKTVGQADIVASIEKVMLGPERKSHILTQKEKEIVAYHEAGHALVAASLEHTDPVHKISIVARGRAGGHTWKLPAEDRHLFSRSYFFDEIAVAMGGYAAEQAVFDELTTGPHSDLEHATAIARDLVTRYGMSDKVGPTVFGERQEMVFLGRDIGTEKNYSEDIAKLIDTEVRRVIDTGLKRAKDIITKRRSTLEPLAKRLIETETLERAELEAPMTAA